MATNTIQIPRPREAVLAVLREPDCYPKWVVGASDVKERSATFPEPGSWFTYAIDVGPLTLSDKPIVESFDDGKVVLRARARPIGAARIELHLRDRDGGTEVEMREYASR